jgi:hypothetical protein
MLKALGNAPQQHQLLEGAAAFRVSGEAQVESTSAYAELTVSAVTACRAKHKAQPTNQVNPACWLSHPLADVLLQACVGVGVVVHQVHLVALNHHTSICSSNAACTNDAHLQNMRGKAAAAAAAVSQHCVVCYVCSAHMWRQCSPQ